MTWFNLRNFATLLLAGVAAVLFLVQLADLSTDSRPATIYYSDDRPGLLGAGLMILAITVAP